MAEAGLNEWDSWRCCHSSDGGKMFCPPEGCPKSYGCAREHGWLPEMPSPDGCTGKASLKSIIEEMADIGSRITDPNNTYGIQMANLARRAISFFHEAQHGEIK